jgi:hypothetical protein
MTPTSPPTHRPALKFAPAPEGVSGAAEAASAPVSATPADTSASAPPSVFAAPHLHSALASPRGSIIALQPNGGGFSRSATGDSTTLGAETKYRRKVGFEAFNEDQPEALFTFTAQVSRRVGVGGG